MNDYLAGSPFYKPMQKLINISGFGLLVLMACSDVKLETEENNIMEAPVAAKKDCLLTIHDHQRIDPYFWIRLTDEQKKAKQADNHTQKVLDYLTAENEYARMLLSGLTVRPVTA